MLQSVLLIKAFSSYYCKIRRLESILWAYPTHCNFTDFTVVCLNERLKESLP